MTAPLLLILLAMSDPTGGMDEDRAELVARLGSARFADREEAAREIRDLGSGAISVIRAARRSPDPEVRARASSLLDALELERLRDATLVEWPRGQLTATELATKVVDDLPFPLDVRSRRTAADATLAPVDGEPRTLTFWEAAGRLEADVDYPELMPRGRFELDHELTIPPQLILDDQPLPPTSLEGPFRFLMRRVSVLEPPRTRPSPLVPSGFDEPPGESGLRISLELQAEPRLRFQGPVGGRLTRAADQDGRELLPSDPEACQLAAVDDSLLPSSSVQLEVDLPLPPDGRTPSLLEGEIEVRVQGRRVEPIVAPLPGDRGERPDRVELGDAAFTVLNVDRDPTDGGCHVDLMVELEGWRDLVIFRRVGRRRFDRFESINRDLDEVLAGIVLVDDQGRRLPGPSGRSTRFAAEGVWVSLHFPAGKGNPRPAELHYRAPIVDRVTIPFRFDDLPAAVR